MASVDDIRLLVTFRDHPKRAKLRRRLGADGVLALVDLWLWVGANKPTGDLSGMSDEDIEIAAGWTGPAGALLAALRELRWMDGQEGASRMHDWSDHQGWASGAVRRSEAARAAGLASAAQRAAGVRSAPVERALIPDPTDVGQGANGRSTPTRAHVPAAPRHEDPTTVGDGSTGVARNPNGRATPSPSPSPKESPPPARTRAIPEPPPPAAPPTGPAQPTARLEARALEAIWISVVKLTHTDGLSDLAAAIEIAALSKEPPADPVAYAKRLVGLFVQWVDGVRPNRRPQKTPRKMLEHLSRLEEIAAGTREIRPAEDPPATNGNGISRPRPAPPRDQEDERPQPPSYAQVLAAKGITLTAKKPRGDA